jgi:predicted lipoprotein with Yx(FWY)xxD motif
MKKIIAVLATLAFLSGCASMMGEKGPAKFDGGVLVGSTNNMTLYTFDKDPAGKSVCNGPCATNWPPLMAAADAKPMGDYTIISRDDGQKQWAYKGKPLYFWIKDTKPGDKTGDGFNNVWRVVKN